MMTDEQYAIRAMRTARLTLKDLLDSNGGSEEPMPVWVLLKVATAWSLLETSLGALDTPGAAAWWREPGITLVPGGCPHGEVTVP